MLTLKQTSVVLTQMGFACSTPHSTWIPPYQAEGNEMSSQRTED